MTKEQKKENKMAKAEQKNSGKDAAIFIQNINIVPRPDIDSDIYMIQGVEKGMNIALPIPVIGRFIVKNVSYSVFPLCEQEHSIVTNQDPENEVFYGIMRTCILIRKLIHCDEIVYNGILALLKLGLEDKAAEDLADRITKTCSGIITDDDSSLTSNIINESCGCCNQEKNNILEQKTSDENVDTYASNQMRFVRRPDKGPNMYTIYGGLRKNTYMEMPIYLGEDVPLIHAVIDKVTRPVFHLNDKQYEIVTSYPKNGADGLMRGLLLIRKLIISDTIVYQGILYLLTELGKDEETAHKMAYQMTYRLDEL